MASTSVSMESTSISNEMVPTSSPSIIFRLKSEPRERSDHGGDNTASSRPSDNNSMSNDMVNIEFEELKNKYAELENKFSRQESELENEKQKVKEKEESLKKARKNASDSMEQLGSVSLMNAELTTRLGKEETMKDELKKEVERKTNSIAEKESEIERLTAKCLGLGEQLEQVNSALTPWEQQPEYTSQQTSIARYRQELKQANQRISELESKVKTAEQRFSEVSSELSKCRKDLETTTEGNLALDKQAAELEKSKALNETKLEEMSATIANLEKSNSEKQSEIDKLKLESTQENHKLERKSRFQHSVVNLLSDVRHITGTLATSFHGSIILNGREDRGDSSQGLVTLKTNMNVCFNELEDDEDQALKQTMEFELGQIRKNLKGLLSHLASESPRQPTSSSSHSTVNDSMATTPSTSAFSTPFPEISYQVAHQASAANIGCMSPYTSDYFASNSPSVASQTRASSPAQSLEEEMPPLSLNSDRYEQSYQASHNKKVRKPKPVNKKRRSSRLKIILNRKENVAPASTKSAQGDDDDKGMSENDVLDEPGMHEGNNNPSHSNLSQPTASTRENATRSLPLPVPVESIKQEEGLLVHGHGRIITAKKKSGTKILKLRKYKCTCKCVFDTSEYLKNHIKYGNSKRRFPCDRCDKRFKTTATLRKHKRKSHDETYTDVGCLACGQTFQTREKLIIHQSRVHKFWKRKPEVDLTLIQTPRHPSQEDQGC